MRVIIIITTTNNSNDGNNKNNNNNITAIAITTAATTIIRIAMLIIRICFYFRDYQRRLNNLTLCYGDTFSTSSSA